VHSFVEKELWVFLKLHFIVVMVVECACARVCWEWCQIAWQYNYSNYNGGTTSSNTSVKHSQVICK